LLRPLFRFIVSYHSTELFTLTALLFAMASAWLSHFAGLSFALGAFLAGMILGETEFRPQIEVDIRPFRDVLLGRFFITIAMTLDIHAISGTVY
jgi:CPA2 family monovalent cation:H+ antiporter-2